LVEDRNYHDNVRFYGAESSAASSS
jgi:hypothetical protein